MMHLAIFIATLILIAGCAALLALCAVLVFAIKDIVVSIINDIKKH